MMKHSKLLFGFLTLLGAAFVTFFFAMPNWSLADCHELLALVHSQQLLANISTGILAFCLFGGIVFLTVGICGIGRQYLKNSPNPFTCRSADSFAVLFLILILSVVFGLFLYFWMGALTVGF